MLLGPGLELVEDAQRRPPELGDLVGHRDRSLAEHPSHDQALLFHLFQDEALEWGLFVSNAIKETEPAQFTEPGMFVIAPDHTLYASMIQTMPFSRPHGAQLLKSLDYIVTNGYPSRGEAQIAEPAKR